MLKLVVNGLKIKLIRWANVILLPLACTMCTLLYSSVFSDYSTPKYAVMWLACALAVLFWALNCASNRCWTWPRVIWLSPALFYIGFEFLSLISNDNFGRGIEVWLSHIGLIALGLFAAYHARSKYSIIIFLK